MRTHYQLLAVDDDVAMLTLIREAVEALMPECGVDTTPNAAYAIELVMRKSYDLLLVDYAMPSMDGALFYSVVTKIFTIAPPPGRALPPMLLLTGCGGGRGPRELLREPGVRGLLAKPFSMERLLEKVREGLKAPLA